MKKAYLMVLAIVFCAGIIFPSQSQGQIYINEYSVSNLNQFPDNYQSYEDWLELYNAGSTTANIGGFYLSDKPGNPLKWQFPSNTTIPAQGFLRVWVSGRNESANGHHHTNFRLNQTKNNPEHILLSDAEGNRADSVQLENTQLGHSRGRTLNGSSGWSVYTSPTPGTSNNAATKHAGYAARPEFSETPGFYSGSVTVSIINNEPNSQIRYTTNGTLPTASSPLYTLPITISSTQVLKARSFSMNTALLPSLIEFGTYFIDESHTLPVFSLSADQVTQLLNGNGALRPQGSIEYFNTAGERTTFSYGEFDKHGQDSWAFPQRSIDFIGRDEMGYKHALTEKLLPLSDRKEFQRIILRASGDDNYPGIDSSAHMRDIWIQNLAQMKGLNLDVRKGARVVMYANGQFWGVYSIREKVNDHDYMNFYYGQDRFNLQFLMFWGQLWAEYGDQRALNDWATLKSYILNSNVNDPVVMQNIKDQYDYTSLIDYVIINSFVVCSDWLNWNVGWWRGMNPQGGHLKWGYILWDEDATFGHYINYTGIPGQHPYVPPCFPESLGSYSDPQQHIVILNKLRQNPEIQQYYVSRYIDLKNTVFVKENLQHYLDSMKAVIEPEMIRHTQRWGGSVMQWSANVNKLRNFISNRCDYLDAGLKSCYGLTGPYNFSVNTYPENAAKGKVKLNSLNLENFPWSGQYYGGMNVLLTATPTDSAYEFSHWELTNHSGQIPDLSSPSISINPNTWEHITAHFAPKTFTDSLVINEINYKSASAFNSEDWVEFYNPHSHDLNIANWVFKDDDDTHSFVFPENTIIPANGYLVLCRDTVKFKNIYPEVTNYLGLMNFGFSSSGELLRLYNHQGALIDTVHYGVDFPWPSEANGGGSTLELIHPSLDNALAESWMASTPGGTPGAMNSLLAYIPAYDGKEQFSVRVSPNPATEEALIDVLSDFSLQNGHLRMYNIFGNEVLSINGIHSNTIKIKKGALPAGIYIFLIQDQKGTHQTSGKIIFK